MGAIFKNRVKYSGDRKYTDDDGTMYSSANGSAISVAGTTWTKLVSIDMTSKPKGKYLIVAEVARSVQDKIYYGRITYNENVNNVWAGGNVPYQTGNITTVVNVTSTITSVDFYIYAQAVEVSQYYASIKAIKL